MKKSWREITIVSLILANIFVFIAIWQRRVTDTLRVYFLDVGQGDAILIDSPSHGRVLVDGGPDGKALTEIGRILPFADRRLDAVIETHPDADHITGLVSIVDRYDVGSFIEPGVNSSNNVHKILDSEILSKDIPHLIARRGLVINFHDGAELQILYPNAAVRDWETNDASIVAKLTYGDRSFLLTGDSTKKAEYDLMAINKNILKSDVLKVAHHGSKNSTSIAYASAVAPEYAVISAGKGNKYGHPNKETLDILNKVGAKILKTIDLGTIEFYSDGKSLAEK